MADTARSQLLDCLKGLLISGEHSDLTITCGSDSYKIHKNIACSRVGFFAGAENFGGKETNEASIDLPDDEPAIVKLLIQYIYEAEYDPVFHEGETGTEYGDVTHAYRGLSKAQVMRMKKKKATTAVVWKLSSVFPHTCEYDWEGLGCSKELCEHHVCGENCDGYCSDYICDRCSQLPGHTPGSEQLLIHAKMYEIADKYHVVGLKELVLEKFSQACQKYWNEPCFAAAAHHAFSTTPDNDLGLRDIVSLTIATHMTELMKKPEVEALLLEFNGLAFGLLKRKMDQGWK